MASRRNGNNGIDKPQAPEPRWLASIALIAVGLLYLALPQSLAIGPRWLLLAVIVVLLTPAILARRGGNMAMNVVLGHAISAVVTLFMVVSLALLIHALPAQKEAPTRLLESAVALWITNVLVFALWYWRLDAGGPHVRESRPGHDEGSFLFPQMLVSSQSGKGASDEHWAPQFLDYLFLAFNTSTALSPTDTAILSRWAKVLMMVQALISLSIVVLLAARAVNIL